MDIYDSEYFRLNKALLVLVGLWPYENKIKKYTLRIIFFAALIIMIIPQLIALQQAIGTSTNDTFLHLLTTIYVSMTIIKFVGSMITENQVKQKTLYDNVMRNWQAITDEKQKKKLIQHSKRARYITIYILAYFAVGDLLYFALPLTPRILDKIKPLNESRPYSTVLEGNFLIDTYENYVELYTFDVITLTITVIVIGSVDTMYSACVLHCVGLLAILKYRLKLSHEVVCNLYADPNKDATYEWMVETIRLHKKALFFKDTLQTSVSTSFLILMGLNMLNMSIISVLILLNSDDYLNLVRYGVLLFGLAMHLFYLSWPGQQLIDYSSGLFRDAYLNEWYRGSERSKRLLRIFTLRCAQHCEITAGGLYTMNFENFASVMKTSASYITVFSSIISH